MISRYSSIHNKNLGREFFKVALKDAIAYDRIAGYFSSSILEMAGEEIEKMRGNVRIICNSQLQSEDIQFIKTAPKAMKDEWCDEYNPERLSNIPDRLKKLYNYLTTNKIQVKVIPNDVFGLIHGKAGIITKKNNDKVAFLGSMNETIHGWSKNYELVWVDNDKEAIDWVQHEFDYLWGHPTARPLAKFIIEDIKRIASRHVIYNLDEYKEIGEPASTVIESPVYRKEYGLWEHQKYFIELVIKHHRARGARFVLADMVGLGKTLQLALSAQLIALEGQKPIMIIVPKTLIWQWQEELMSLLELPSAVWDGQQWVDERKVPYYGNKNTMIKKCPRRIGIIPQSIIVANTEYAQKLLNLQYDCIIVDEAHRARRKNLGKGKEDQTPVPNNLMDFLLKIAFNTKTLLLATATPVQMYPIEAWDLLYILSQNAEFVLGNEFSNWMLHKRRGLEYVVGRLSINNETEYWDWIRNPLPLKEEGPDFQIIRRQLNLRDEEYIIPGDLYSNLLPPQKAQIKNIIHGDFILHHNPYIRHIIRRTRQQLENELNPETNEPFLKKIKVELFGENDDEAITLRDYLKDAYQAAEEFSQLLKQRVNASGFIKTLLLKRMGSSMQAGLNTSKKMLDEWSREWDDEEDAPETYFEKISEIKNLSGEEKEKLEIIVELLKNNIEYDPKYELIRSILFENKIKQSWNELGCIIFSQYYDSIQWLSEKLTIDFPEENIGIYAGGDKSGVIQGGIYKRKSKDEIKKLVKAHEIRLLLGTDAASEGLNLQTLGTLINLDLPWNPTRLEQRKGRIQRIGQERDVVYIYNLRYKDSIEDRVHRILSNRLKDISNMFGQIPDVLEDVWIDVALNDIEEAEKRIDRLPKQHPFTIKYQKNVEPVMWENCVKVLDKFEKSTILKKGW